jgi:hypothetical protein
MTFHHAIIVIVETKMTMNLLPKIIIWNIQSTNTNSGSKFDNPQFCAILNNISLSVSKKLGSQPNIPALDHLNACLLFVSCLLK